IRLLAEGLVQAGDQASARPFLDHLINTADIKDFDVLLRRAEIAFAVEDQKSAQSAIERAAAAADNPAHQALAAVLKAQLSIRAARFDEARIALSTIVRGTDAPPEVRARSQWLVAETHFLQRNYLK